MRKDIVPNRLILLGTGIGVVFRIIWDIRMRMPLNILVMALEVIVLFFCLWPVYAMGGLGAGDCKLLLMAGIFLPAKQAILVIISTFFIAAGQSILLVLICKIKKEKRKVTSIHFTPSFLLAVLVYQCGRVF